MATIDLGYRPHEKQLEFHNNTSRYKLFLGGIRSGKTVAGALESILYSVGAKAAPDQDPMNPVQGLVVANDYSQIEKVCKAEILKWLPRSLTYSHE